MTRSRFARRAHLLPLAVLALLALAPSTRVAAAEPEDWLPPGTLVHVRMDSPRRLLASLAGHPFAALAQEPEIAAFVESLSKTIPASSRADAAVRAFEITTILSVLSGPVTISILGFPEAGSPPDVLLTLGVSDTKAFSSGVSLGTATLVSSTPGASSSDRELGGMVVSTIDHPEWHAAHALVGSTFVLSNRDDVIVAAANAMRAAGRGAAANAPCLAAEPSFRAVTEAVAGTNADAPGVSAYVHLGSFLPLRLSRGDSEDRALVRALGLGGVTALGWRLGVEAGGIVDRFALASPGGFGGLLGSFPTNGRGLEAAANAPAGSLVSMAWQIDPLRAWDAAMGAIREVNPVSHEVLADELRAFESGFGQDFRDALLGAMTGEMRLTASLRAESAAKPDVDLVFGVRDAEAIRRAAKRFSETIQGPRFRAIDFEGETIFVPTGDEAALAAFAPSYCATADALIVSISPDSLKRALAARRTDGETIGSSPEWRELSSKVASRAGAPFGAQYFDGRQMFSLVYNALVPLLQSFSGLLELPIDAALIPSSDAITRHISASLCAVSRTDKTLTVTSFGPLPSPTGPVALAAAGFALFKGAAQGDVQTERWSPVAMPAPAGARSDPNGAVTIHRTDAPLAEVIEEIAKASGLQFVAPGPLLGAVRVSLRIDGVPAREALEIVCASAGLQVTERKLSDGRTVMVISAR